MNRFRTKIIFALATLILIVLVGLGLLLGQLFKSFYINTFEERMQKEANLIALLIDSEDFLEDKTKEEMNTISKQLDSDITIILPNGETVLDTNQTITKKDILDDLPKLQGILKRGNTDFKGFYSMSEKSGLFHYVTPLKEKNKFEGYLIFTLPVEPLQKINQKIWGLLISSLGVAFILVLMLATRITSQYTKPIEDATRVANELAKGNYRARTYEDRLDETGMLSQSINILARNLQQMTAAHEMQQDRLRTLIESMGSGLILIDSKGYINLVNRFYKEIFHVEPADYLYRLYYDAFQHKEVIELVEEIFMMERSVRRQLHLPLQIERRHFEVYGAPIIGSDEEWKGIVLVFHDITELKKLEQMRKDFVANVSHELKTPITSIKGFSETLLDGAMEDNELREYFLKIILKETDRLQSLINDLLDLSKIEQEGFKLNIQEVDLKEAIEDITVMLQGKAEERSITLTSHLDERMIILQADQNRIKQVFINLINNALNYTLPGGKVDISVVDKGETVEFSISDTGIGMSKDQIPRIFERFYRIDKARSRNSGGTGLGLAIVKHLVEAHQGKIEVKSEKDVGTTFKVTFYKHRLTNH